jgi:ketosteroid isomerase-like protein
VEAYMTTHDVISETYPEEQARIVERIHELLGAVQERDIDRLESYHLYGPKFTRFDDFEPLDRQDAQTARRIERETLEWLKTISSRVSDLRVDVFGPAAVATFVYDFDGLTRHDERFAGRARGTFVLVRDRAEWKIAHEHFSPFSSNA